MTTVRRSIDRRANGNWRARYRDPRTHQWRSRSTFITKAAAREWLDQEIAGLNIVDVDVDKARTTVDTFMTTVFWPIDSVKESSAATYRSAYKHHIQPRWGGTALGDIRRVDIELWRSTLQTSLGSESMVRKCYWVLHKVISRAVEMDYLLKSPLPFRSGLGRTAPRKPEPLDPSVIEAFVKAMKPPYDLLVLVLAYGGLRISEAAALRVDDLDFTHNEISVDEAVTEGVDRFDSLLKRERAHRSVPMPSLVMDELRAYVIKLDPADRHQLLFPSDWGRPMRVSNWRRRHFTPVKNELGLPNMRPHDFRHTAASMWFDAGFDIVEVARFLGDSLKTAEEVYTHMFKGRQRHQVQALNTRIIEGRGDNVIPMRREAIG